MGGGRRVVFVVDDSPLIRDLLEVALEEVGEVRTFEGGRAALEEIDDADLLITDLMMPEFSGLELADAVSARGLATPVIIITGCDPGAPGVQEVQERGLCLFAKPFSLRELRAAARLALGETRLPAPPADLKRFAG